MAATAALVRSAWPQLTAAEVAARILATATPAPGGRDSAAYGAGLVNPYRAVTDGLDSAEPAVIAPLRVPAPTLSPPPLPAMRILGGAVAARRGAAADRAGRHAGAAGRLAGTAGTGPGGPAGAGRGAGTPVLTPGSVPETGVDVKSVQDPDRRGPAR